MALDKARLQAERKLVEMHGSKINSLTKSNRTDTGDTMVESTSITVQKNANGELIGAQRVDSQVSFDGQKYRAFVLLRLPLSDNNILRKERVNTQTRKEAELRAGRAQQELEQRRVEEARAAEAADARLKAELGPKPEVSVAPAAEVKIEQ
jgi:tetrahydrodipicolinate N-succinyltransferase